MFLDLGFFIGLVVFLAVLGLVCWLTLAMTRKR